MFNEEINLISAEELILPNYYAPFAFMGMFRACTNLNTAPTMPSAPAVSFGDTNSEIINTYPYFNGNAFFAFAYMFKRCYSLNEVKLNFAYVANQSRRWTNDGGMATNQMFSECTGLTKITWTGKTAYSVGSPSGITRLSPATASEDMFVGITQPG